MGGREKRGGLVQFVEVGKVRKEAYRLREVGRKRGFLIWDVGRRKNQREKKRKKRERKKEEKRKKEKREFKLESCISWEEEGSPCIQRVQINKSISEGQS